MKKILSKIILPCSLILLTLTMSFAAFRPAFAGGGDTDPSSADTTGGAPAASDECRYFLGLVSWDCNLDLKNIKGETDLRERFWTIAGNVATDLTVIAAYLILGYVIYGGYLYICSNGDPGKVATGKKVLAQAFIGLAIVMSANVILNGVRIALGGDFSKQCVTIDNGSGSITTECYKMGTAGNMVTSVIQWVVGIAGLVAVVFVVFGGISYITSSGDPQKTQQAKNIILYALIGLVLVALAEIITAFVSNLIRTSTQTALDDSTTALVLPAAPGHRLDTTLIKKEYYEITKIS